MKIVTCFELGQLCEGPMSQLFLEWLREIFRLKGKIPYVHTMDLYVNLLLDHSFALCISSSCIAMVFLGAKFHTIVKNKNIHVTYSLFPGKVSAKFWNFWKIWKLFAAFGLRKKRKVWDIIFQILSAVELVLHSHSYNLFYIVIGCWSKC